ncbi:hypothetical protein OUZ56_024991 [Daphnia magna]|uniref:Uncharacterized protein n=1 Tax=Daphnia magna TaxID=35525 RepID=A0ABQ9ZIK8_9CRUS|nr:hypothetical protein OUZ56_024991 [Daphnia magna]
MFDAPELTNPLEISPHFQKGYDLTKVLLLLCLVLATALADRERRSPDGHGHHGHHDHDHGHGGGVPIHTPDVGAGYGNPVAVSSYNTQPEQQYYDQQSYSVQPSVPSYDTHQGSSQHEGKSGGWVIIFRKCGAQNERIPAIKTSVKVITVRQLCDALRQTVDITMERQLKVVTVGRVR